MATDAGFDFTRAAIEQATGSFAVQLDNVLDAIAEFKVRLIDDHTQAEIRAIFAAGAKQGEDQAATDAKADLCRSTILDLETVARVARAQVTVPTVNDFFFNARKTTGVTGA